MSEQTIYNALRSGGLTPSGACAMMGNMYCESGLISYRVQGDCKSGYTFSKEDTAQVDNGTISEYDFIHNGVNGGGYGLCQWTYYTRKAQLYNYARSAGTSIGDEEMQCAFALVELSSSYVNLLSFLRTTDDLAEASKRICAEFERPAVNNFADRINMAQRYFNQFGGGDFQVEQPIEKPPIAESPRETCNVAVRTLRKGDLGRDVFLLQCGLTDMGHTCGIPDGDFGRNTDSAVRQLQKANEILENGVADWFVWQTILNER